MNVAQRIQSLRKAKGMSQEQLGEALGVSRQAVSKWESGQSIPDIDNIIQMSKVFDVTTDHLLKGESPKVVDSIATMASATNYAENEQISPMFTGYYEYRSRREIFGLPLIHINISYSRYYGFRRIRRAKGIIAVGDIAIGLLALGPVALGGISIGLMSIGLAALGAIAVGGIALGGLAIGLLALGGLAIGGVTLGGASIGVYSIGGAAFASKVAVGDVARAKLAIGNEPRGIMTVQVSQMSNEMIRTLVLEQFPRTPKWIVGLLASF